MFPMEIIPSIDIVIGGNLLIIWAVRGGRSSRPTMFMAGIGVASIGYVPPGGMIYVLPIILFVGQMLPILKCSVNAMLQACNPLDMQGRSSHRSAP
jgi:hypothetical protein